MLVPLFVSLVGGVLYVIPLNAKASELARITFFVGLFWLVYELAKTTVRIG